MATHVWQSRKNGRVRSKSCGVKRGPQGFQTVGRRRVSDPAGKHPKSLTADNGRPQFAAKMRLKKEPNGLCKRFGDFWCGWASTAGGVMVQEQREVKCSSQKLCTWCNSLFSWRALSTGDRPDSGNRSPNAAQG